MSKKIYGIPVSTPINPAKIDPVVPDEKIARDVAAYMERNPITPESIGARPDYWLPTIAEIGAAPAGFVSGGFQATEVGQIASGLLNVYRTMQDLTIKHVYIEVEANGLELGGGRWLATIYRQHGSLAVVKAIDLIAGYERQTTITNSVVGELEYINPPMSPGVEYRTTERWNGKAVYTMLINCGTMPTAGGTNRIDMPSNINGWIDKVLRATGTDSSGDTIPYSWQGEYITEVSASRSAIYIYSKDDYSDNTADVQIWYTKH